MINEKRELLRKVLLLVLVMDRGSWSEIIMVGNLARKRRVSHSVSNCKECGIRKHRTTYNKTDGAPNIVVTSAADSGSEVLALVSELFDELWVLDLESSYHVTSNKEWFST
jgi:hypothetical protein